MSMMSDGALAFAETVTDPEIAGRQIIYMDSSGRGRRINATSSQERREIDRTRGIAVIRYKRRVTIKTDRTEGVKCPQVDVDRVCINSREYVVKTVTPVGDSYAFLDVESEALQESQRSDYRGFK